MQNTSFQVSQHGNLLMYDRKYSAADVRYIIESNHLNGLRIFDYSDPLDSLEFLREFTFLRRLEITCWDDQDFSFLSGLTQLEDLDIGPSFPMENTIDISHQINVRSLALQWRKNRINGLEACQNVEDLCLIEFKNSDLTVLSNLTKIVRLRIKTGSMKSLDGIENLSKLKDLEIGNCRSLRSINHLNGLQELHRVRIESCRKIEDIEDLADLPSLSILQFVNCGEIPNLVYTNRFPNLTKLDLLGATKLRNFNSQ